MTMSKKYKDLQPWLDYFEMLKAYVNDEYLQMDVERHECFVIQSAIHAMSDGDNPMIQMRDGSIEKTARRLRAFAGWKSCEGASYLHQQFAVHVVADEGKHDPLYTILLTMKHHLWKWVEKTDVVIYPQK